MIELNKLTLKYKALFVIDGKPAQSLSKDSVPDTLTFRPAIDWKQLREKYACFGDDVLCIFNGADSRASDWKESELAPPENGEVESGANQGPTAGEDGLERAGDNILVMDSSANYLDTQKVWLLIGAFS